MKLAHISDTHIRNLKFHREYRAVFKSLYEKLKKQEVDYIVHCGDIAHTKTQLSPEFVEMASDFFKNLSSIAPTYIILGNHDGNLKNSSRQDAISPIIEALNLPDLHLLKNSGETDIGDNICLNVLSVFDRDNWTPPTDESKINIALYHGAIAGVFTDKGYQLEHGEDNIEIFQHFDYAFLGDIHKTNQILDHEGRIRYSGSTVQQNHGESNDKGYLLWDIEDKDSFTCTHTVLKNPNPFISVILNKDGTIPKDSEVPPGARLRLITNSPLSISQLKRAMEASRTRFGPESVTYLNRSGKLSDNNDGQNLYTKRDLRDPKVQREMISEYLKQHEVSSELMGKIYKLNDKYNAQVLANNENMSRNTNWELKKLEWNNLFNYGEENSVDFASLGGIIGVFGKNYSGKSSVVDSLLWVIFGTTSKNDRKNLNVINQNKEECSGNVSIGIGNKEYRIFRTASKYTKRLKGEETLEAKSEVTFNVYDKVSEVEKSLNGLTVNETNGNIRDVFGDVEDFLLTSMASQLDSLSFIGEGSKKRKEILTKFLDLESFDKKYSAAKADSSDTKAILRKLEGEDYTEKVTELELLLIKNEREEEISKNFLSTIKEELISKQKEVANIEQKISSVPVEVIDINLEISLVEKYKVEISKLENLIQTTKESNLATETKIMKTEEFLEGYDESVLREKKEICAKLKNELNLLHADSVLKSQELTSKSKKLKLLDEVPCGTEFSHCKFIKDAYTAKSELPLLQEALTSMTESSQGITSEISSLNEEEIDSTINKYDFILSKIPAMKTLLAENRLKINKCKGKIEEVLSLVEVSEEKIQTYNQNKEAIENLELLSSNLSSLRAEEESIKLSSADAENDILNLVKSRGNLEAQVQNLKDKQEELETLRDEYHAYDLFMQCMHSNGISSDIVKSQLPIINDEIAKILDNVVDFGVMVINKDKRLEITIKHPRFDARPIEMGSGAEKTISAMAIRLALLNVSSMPKADIMILDEPGTALDEENMQGFITILDIIKNYFKNVVLISHLESLKDCVDQQIMIDKVDGYAKVNC